MTTQPHEGGRRPLDLVLAPGFADDVADLTFEDLRERRHLAEQEEADLSYARRLLQARLDLLRDRRQHPDAVTPGTRSDADLARDLALVLADEAPRQDRGLGRHLSVDPTRVGEHRRAAEQAVADLTDRDAASIDRDAAALAIEPLSRLELEVSQNRHRVQHVMAVLTAELARRYRSGEARVEDVLAAD